MATLADWIREMVDAAEERGWAVIAIDSRGGWVTLEEPSGSGGITVRIQGRELDAAFVRQMPEAGRWAELAPRERTMPDGTPCWCVDGMAPGHAPGCVKLRGLSGVAA